MPFCSFTKDSVTNASTIIDNKFIASYLPEANGDAVKVYLYGLFVCQTGDEDITFDKFCENVKLEKEEVCDCFKFWEELGIVNVISEEPFIVRYLPVTSARPKNTTPKNTASSTRLCRSLSPRE